MQEILNINTRDLGDEHLDIEVVDLDTADLVRTTVDLGVEDLDNIAVSSTRLTAIEETIANLQGQGNVRYDIEQALTEDQQLQARKNIGVKYNDIQVNTTDYWNSRIGYIPAAGTIIVYSDYKEVNGKVIPGIKVGSGNGYVQDLGFVSEDTSTDLLEHINNTIVHVTSQDRLRWDHKIDIDDTVTDVEEETLIFTRN